VGAPQLLQKLSFLFSVVSQYSHCMLVGIPGGGPGGGFDRGQVHFLAIIPPIQL
jgi:hypothetical protein